MKIFIVDERVPCKLSELRQPPFRKPLADLRTAVSLGVDVAAVPMIAGWRLATDTGFWYVEDLRLIERLAAGAVVPQRLVPTEIAELEELNAADMLTSGDSRAGVLKRFDQGASYRHLYAPNETSWFAMSPLHLELDLTNRCNQCCIHCCRESSPSASTDGELTTRELLFLLNDAAEIGVDEVSFLGGEPTLQPHLIELAYFARKRGIHRLNLATNALALDADLLSLARSLFSNIQVSLHGASAETHEAVVRHSGAYERVLKNIARLVERGANVVLAFTVMRSNLRELNAAVVLARELGVTGIRFIPLADEGLGRTLPALVAEDYVQAGALIRAAQERSLDLDIASGGFPTDEETPSTALFYGCIAGLTKLYVNARGVVGGCSLLGVQELSVRGRSLLDVWHDRTMRRSRRRLSCDCPFVTRCAGGCLSVPKHNRAMSLGG
jgi:MoaA/NifB/PqqE/SkfB family radical SAM enzyme